MIVYNECNVDTNEEGNYHFPLISLLIHGKILITTHFEWISYPLFSKKDLISFRMWGSSSWKIKIAPFSARYLFAKPNIPYIIIYVTGRTGDNSGRFGDKINWQVGWNFNNENMLPTSIILQNGRQKINIMQMNMHLVKCT